MTNTRVLVSGHERGPGAPGFPAAVIGGRAAHRAVSEALATAEGPVCVVPMTLGRDPHLVADTARALHWLARCEGAGRIVLAEPFGTQDHLVGWLRAAVRPYTEPGTAVLLTAPAADPFDDADLFRVARLVRQYGQHRWVEVAFRGGDPDIAEGIDRCRRLGARQVVLVPAAFGTSGAESPARPRQRELVDHGALLTPSAIAGVIEARTTAALHRLEHGDDGIGAGLEAEHGHGYAHTHGPADHDHSHTSVSHAHSQHSQPSHTHPHPYH
ncbi:cobalamin biosynthesis protein CbiX [Streptomyces sp. NPDC050658]|uniref:cobalamin biosynthesis protein CbiX n=1 Tax=unclassified Streptomyces TaxID=2593676 RepID=UPI003428D67D